MKETDYQSHFPLEEGETVEQPATMSLNLPVAKKIPSEESLVIIAMLMRLYDIQLAMLNQMNPAEADRVYEAHEKGEHFNPEIFIPTPQEVEQ